MRKIVVGILACTLLISIIASCAPANEGKDDITTTVTTTNTDTQLREDIIPPDIEAVDYDGYKFTILSREPVATTYPYNEIDADTTKVETISDAVYKRNAKIEEKYSIEIVSLTTSQGVQIYARNLLLAQEYVFDAIFGAPEAQMQLATYGLLVELSEIDHLNFSKAWWNQTFINDVSIGGKCYFAPSDSNIAYLNAVSACFFNKKIIDDFQLDNPYDLVYADEWNWDKFLAMAKAVTADIDGIPGMGMNDRYGIVTNSVAYGNFVYGSGFSFIAKDDADFPILDLGSENLISIVKQTVDILNADYTLLINKYQYSGNLQKDVFNNERALFVPELLYAVHSFIESDVDYGLVPMPKYSENQTDYYSYAHKGWSSTVSVPDLNNVRDMTGRIIEDMAFESYVYVRPAFMDVVLKGRYSTDENFVKMVDLIYKNVRMDLTTVLAYSGLGLDTLLRNMVINNQTNVASQFEANKNAYEAVINTVAYKLTEIQ